MSDIIDPTLPTWARGIISILRESVITQMITVLIAAATLWVQSHNQHAERIAQNAAANAEQVGELKAIQSKLPGRVFAAEIP